MNCCMRIEFAIRTYYFVQKSRFRNKEQVLSKDEWKNTLTKEYLRALTTLIYNHINLYGNFELDMDKRFSIKIKISEEMDLLFM